MTFPAPEAHLDPHEVTGYLEGTIAPAERARLEAHLGECEECTAELAAVFRLRRPAALPVKRLALGAIAAAVITIILVGRPHDRLTGNEGTVERGTIDRAMSAIAPAEGAALSSPPLFVWNTVRGAAIYHLSVTRPNGDSVWAASVRDTAVRVPDSVLAAGTYYWFVDALLSDGRSVAGKAREFRLGP